MSQREEVEQLLSLGLQRFELAAQNVDPVAFTCGGLNDILKASQVAPDMREMFPGFCTAIAGAVCSATNPLIIAMARTMSDDEVCFAMGTLADFVKAVDETYQEDRVLHLTIFQSSLMNSLCRRKLADRGDALARIFSVRKAWSAPKNPQTHLS